MTKCTPSESQVLLRLLARAAGTVAAGVLVAGLVGCEADSYLDPSVIGRWERTPTTVPILTRIASVEGPEDEVVEYVEPQPEDLVPELDSYRVGPGDTLSVVIWETPIPKQSFEYTRKIDSRGFVDLPEAGRVQVSGLTIEQVQDAIGAALADRVANPLVSADVREARQLTYNVLGAIANPGPYFIPTADFRILDALSAAGGFPETTKDIYVIRQIPLTSQGETPLAPEPVDPDAPPPAPVRDGEKLIDLIDELSGDKPATPPSSIPATPIEPPPAAPPNMGAMRGQPMPLIDGGSSQGRTQATSWAYVDGRWQSITRASGRQDEGDKVVTQRVVKIPVQRLLAGDARYNVVIRPGDIVRVPDAPRGTIFFGGQINRPGAFQLSQDLTLRRAVEAAGGLGPLAIPERVELVRMVGDNRQAIVRLNLRAIAEGSQPDIFLKANDLVNIGTNFWAYPLSVIRNGFRATYGFGFLMDRNFGNDVFGAPPTNFTDR